MYFRGKKMTKKKYFFYIPFFLLKTPTPMTCASSKKSYNFYESLSQNSERGDWFLPHKSLVGIS